MEIHLLMLIPKVFPQLPQVVFVVLPKMLLSSVHPWAGQPTRVLTAQGEAADATALSLSCPPVRALMCTLRLHLPVIFTTALPVGHKGTFYQLRKRKSA